MRSMGPKLLMAAAACAYLLGATSGALAVTADHLKCVKAKEISGPGKIQATIGSLGCTLKGPPKLVCTPVVKSGVSPTPPGGGPTGATTKFLCYKVKCPKIPGSLTAKDQFGTHSFSTSSVKTLCAPASPSGAFLDGSSTF